VVARGEWRHGELYLRVGYIATNLTPTRQVVKRYSGRGAAA
jgi:hypothetical protein